MALAFLNRRRAEPTTLGRKAPATLGFDFHSHLLPGVDDGMETFAQCCDAITQMKELGFAGAVTTPHIYRGVFDNKPAELREAFAEFIARLGAIGERFQIYLAAEYFTDEHFLTAIGQDDLLYLPVGMERWVLIEFPYAQESPYASPCLSALVARGYRPVIAHVERYRFVAASPDMWLARFSGLGCVLQGDIGSLVGQHGPSAQKLGQVLLDRGLITLWGTDLHKPAQLGRHIVPGLARLAAIERLNPELDFIKLGEAE